ncbi:MAG: LysR family transcriptional regulator [Beijerinckiaceae bacterium]|nr:LysR family transcriptional regulator [Beijerinckiaceae bacterium]
MRLNWDDLRIVAAVHRDGTFARAAKALRIDETTIARRLARAEQALGFVLFDAVDGLRRATPRCLALLEPIAEMAEAAQRALAIARTSGAAARLLRITATASIAEHVLAPDLASFLAAHPDIALEFELSDRNMDFSRWQTDLAIRLGKPERGNFKMRKLGDIRFILFQPAERGADHDALFGCCYPPELAGTPEMVELAALALPTTMRLKTSSISLIRTAIQSGKASGVLPRHAACDLQTDPAFVATPLKARREAWLLMQPHLQTDAEARLVIDWIASRFVQMAA